MLHYFWVRNLERKERHTPVGEKIRTTIQTRLQDMLDVSFAVSTVNVDSMEEFYASIYEPFQKMTAPIYYRGERKNAPDRRLIPTILRNVDDFRETMMDAICTIDSKKLYGYYEKDSVFMSVFEALYGKPSYENMYAMLAFAQHYLDMSPFIDFSKNLFVALSFALKGRSNFPDDIVLYTAIDIGDDDSTEDVEEVNEWLCNYKVHLFQKDLAMATSRRYNETPPPADVFRKDLKRFQEVLNTMSPTAKLINIPTNDLMRYQQGVFLLLNNFSLIDSNYLTKAVRQSFVINKYVISKKLCPQLLKWIQEMAPQFQYPYLLDIKAALRRT